LNAGQIVLLDIETPHVAQQITNRCGSNIDTRTTRHPGYEGRERKRKRVEEVFARMRTCSSHRRDARSATLVCVAGLAMAARRRIDVSRQGRR